MFNNIIKKFNKLESTTIKLIKSGVTYSSFICIIASLLLFFNQIANISFALYYIGIFLFKTGLVFICSFIICGLTVDYIKNTI